MRATHSATIFTGGALRSFLSNVTLRQLKRWKNQSDDRTPVLALEVRQSSVNTDSVSLGSRNASASSFSRHSLQAGGSLCSSATSRPDGSLFARADQWARRPKVRGGRSRRDRALSPASYFTATEKQGKLGLSRTEFNREGQTHLGLISSAQAGGRLGEKKIKKAGFLLCLVQTVCNTGGLVEMPSLNNDTVKSFCQNNNFASVMMD